MGCLRAGLGVVVGYAAMFVLMFIVFTGAYVLLGADGAFKEGSFEPSMVWTALSLVVGFIVALLGGWVCTKIAPSKGALMALIILIVALGGLQVVMMAMAEDPGPRADDLSSMEAMMQAVTPVWVAVANLVIGVVGAYAGGKGGAKSKA